jgi:triacylglycerol lipase
VAPAPTGARPVLVFVHGGGFTGGNRRTGDSPFYDNIMLWALKNGMVGVNMTYRLAPQSQWPAAQQDIASALAWVQDNIASHGGDPSRIVLMGHSPAQPTSRNTWPTRSSTPHPAARSSARC